MKVAEYKGINERTYTLTHPKVLQWSKFFSDRFKSHRIFERFEQMAGLPSEEAAKVVAVQWYRFSELMPWVLCTATARFSSNKIRHYTIQSAFEELGMREETEIHADLFWESALLVGVTDTDRLRLSNDRNVTSALNVLKSSVTKAKPDAELLGFLLGLEILANENIETLFSSMNHEGSLAKPLSETKFFKIHRVVEAEHIRLAVSNFLRFCKTPTARSAFIKGCDKGLDFWSRFWMASAQLIQQEEQSHE